MGPTAHLEPLTCRACGAPVPLVEGATAPCVHCGARVEIPRAYRELCDTAAERGRVDTAARALYSRLAKRPGLVLRVLSGWFSPAALAVGVFPAMFIAGVLCEVGVAEMLSLATRENYFDTWLPDRSSWEAVAIGLVLAYSGTIAGVFGQRHALSRGALQAALSARSPRVPGAHSDCRMCGAPLVAKDGDLGVACQYCGADNLLVVPSPWLKQLEEGTLSVLRAMASARDALTRERARTRATIRRYLLGLTPATVLALLAFRSTIHETAPTLADWPPVYRIYRGEAVPEVAEHRLVDQHGLLYPDVRRLPAGSHCNGGDAPILSSLAPERCHSGACEFRYYAALAPGDAATIAANDVPPEASLAVARHRGMSWDADDDWRSPRPEFGPTVLAGALAPGQRISFAPQDGAWHRIVVSVPDVGARRDVALCVQIERRRSP